MAILLTASHAFGLAAEARAARESRTYRVTFRFDGQLVAQGCRTMTIRKAEDNVENMTFTIFSPLDLTPSIGHLADFDRCFPTGAVVTQMHGLFRDKQNPAKVNGTLFFPGLDTRGKEIYYRFDYSGTVIDPFTGAPAGELWTPSAIGTSAMVRLDTWSLEADIGGKHFACMGSGLFVGDTILVERLLSCP